MTILPFTGIFDLFYKRRKETWCEIPNKNKGSLGVVAFLLSTMWSGFLENEKCYSIRNPRNENMKSLRLCFPELTRIDHAWSSQLCPRVQHMPSHSRCKMATLRLATCERGILKETDPVWAALSAEENTALQLTVTCCMEIAQMATKVE